MNVQAEHIHEGSKHLKHRKEADEASADMRRKTIHNKNGIDIGYSR